MPTENRSINPVKSAAVQISLSWADFAGAGAAAPTVSPATQLASKDNYAYPRDGNTAIILRNGIGSHEYTFPTAPAVVMDVRAGVRGVSNLFANVKSWAVVGGRLVVTINTWAPGGAATDLAIGDFMRVPIEGNLSNA